MAYKTKEQRSKEAKSRDSFGKIGDLISRVKESVNYSWMNDDERREVKENLDKVIAIQREIYLDSGDDWVFEHYSKKEKELAEDSDKLRFAGEVAIALNYLKKDFQRICEKKFANSWSSSEFTETEEVKERRTPKIGRF